MSILRRAIRVYREEGLRMLAQKGWNFAVWEFFPEKILWNILSESRTKSFLSRSKLLTTIYFYIRGSFYYEQRAILNGQSQYAQKEDNQSKPEHKIIRDTHRIEKGLSMDERRDTFAEGYVEELVDAVQIAWINESEISKSQLRWSTDVLTEYFEVVEHTSPIKHAYSQFSDLLDQIDYTPDNRVPRSRSDLERDPVEYDSLLELAQQRSSTRWFKQEPVPHELIDEAVDVAAQSPSACNRQSYEFRIYDDPEILEDLRELPIGVRGYAENIPCLVVLVGKHRAYFHDRDKHVIYIDASLSAMAFQLALESLGLASCSINWPAIRSREKQLEELINLDPDEEAIMFMAVGYPDPDGMIPYSEKKPLDAIRSYNET